MKISELLRGLADLIDREQGPTMSVQVTQQVDKYAPEAQTADDLARMKVLSGLRSEEPREHANEPQPMVSDIENVLHNGTDLNKSKHPADIRTNAPSMYPAWQATRED